MFAAYANYWDFRGRAGRSEYWLFVLWNVLLGVAAGLVDAFAFHDGGAIGPAALFATFANLIPNLSLGFRRLHDVDRSAWWTLLVLAPFVGALALLVLAALPGTRGGNRFGPEPGGHRLEDLEATFA